MKLTNAALGSEYSNHANEIQLKLVDHERNRIPQKQISKVLDLNLAVKGAPQETVGKILKENSRMRNGERPKRQFKE